MTTQVQQPVEIIRLDPWMSDYGTLFEQRHIRPIARGLRTMFFDVAQEGRVADNLPVIRRAVAQWWREYKATNDEVDTYEAVNVFLAKVVDRIAKKIAAASVEGREYGDEAIDQIAYALWDEIGLVAPELTVEGVGYPFPAFNELVVALWGMVIRAKADIQRAMQDVDEAVERLEQKKAVYEIASRKVKEAEAKWLQATDHYDGTPAAQKWIDDAFAFLQKAEAEKAQAHDEMGFACQEWVEADEYLKFVKGE